MSSRVYRRHPSVLYLYVQYFQETSLPLCTLVFICDRSDDCYHAAILLFLITPYIMLQRLSSRVGASAVAFLLSVAPLTAAAQQVATPTPAVPVESPATAPADAPVAKQPAELSPELNLFMEVYFVQLKAKFFKKAYASTSTEFKKNMKLSEFTAFAEAARLVDFTGKTWVDKQWDPKTGLINLRGEFVAGGETHTISFQLIKKGETYEVLTITETLSLQLLASMFPKEEDLQAFLVKDLSSIEKAVKRGSFRKLYNHMGKNAKKSIKFTAFNKAMKAFRKEKKDIQLPAGKAVTITQDYPKIMNDGSVEVKGTYANATYTVDFTLVYSYEWAWKLSGININPTLLSTK